MARKRKSAGPGRVNDKVTRTVTVKAPSVVGRPGFTETGQQKRLGTIRPFKAKGIKTLIKKDIAKGITQPEASVIERKTGQITPAAVPSIQHQQPQVPAKTGKNKRVIAAPSPTSGAGVRSPFNAKTKVGKRGKNTRFNKN